MDNVDNGVTQGRSYPAKVDKEGGTVPSEYGVDHSEGSRTAADVPRGSDLAREALRAAQASAKARGRSPGARGRMPSGRNAAARKRRRWSGARPDDRDPQPLGRLASRLAADRGWATKLSGGQVFGKWAALVGADVAEHVEPVTLNDGELTVRADSTAWATQLRLLQRQLLAKIAAGVGDGVVKRLKVQGPSAPSWRHGPRRVPGRGPRDTYG